MRKPVLLAVFAALSAQAQTWVTLHQSQYATWVTPDYNKVQTDKYKANIDSIATELDAAIPLITTYLGIKPEKQPIRVEIDSSTEGLGGWAGGGDVGYQISCFFGRPKNSDGLRWIRGVVIGEVINASTGAVTDNWPRDWWVDDVWYFPGFMAGEILKTTVSDEFSNYWLTSESYPTYPVYNVFKLLLAEQGWDYWKRFFATITADKMEWGKIGANPSKLKTDYVIAYMGLAAGRNLGGTMKTAKVSASDSVEVAAIMYVERGLIEADKQKKSTASAWSDFRAGNYASAKTKLDAMGIVVSVRFAEGPSMRAAAPRWFSLDGRAVPEARSPLYLIQRAGSTQRKP